jgi:hypothetical protein
LNRLNARPVLGRAIAYAIATAIAALLCATVLSGSEAERFATTAYLAAIFAALAFTARWFLPADRNDRAPSPPLLPFPAGLTFGLIVTLLLAIGAAFVSDPGAEALIIVFGFGAVGAIALVRAGAARALHDALLRGGRLPATTRYAALAGVLGLAFAAFLQPDGAEALVKTGYFAAVLAAMSVLVSLVGRTRAGGALGQTFARAARLLTTPASEVVFTRTADYAAASALFSVVLAIVVREPNAERFATTAYVAAFFAALALGMKWRLRGFAVAPLRSRTPVEIVEFYCAAGLLTLVGAALATSPVAEGAGVLACFCAIGAAIALRSGVVAVPDIRPVRLPTVLLKFALSPIRLPSAAQALRAGIAATYETLRNVAEISAVAAVIAIIFTIFLPKAYAPLFEAIAFAAMTIAAVAIVTKSFGPALRRVWLPKVLLRVTLANMPQVLRAGVAAGYASLRSVAEISAVAAVIALILTVLLPKAYAPVFETIAFAATTLAALAIVARSFVPSLTPIIRAVMPAKFTREVAAKTIIGASVATAVIALLLTALLPKALAAHLALVAYVATSVATLGLGVNWFLRWPSSGDSARRH